MDDREQQDHEREVVVEAERRVEPPPLYKVLLHNDDYTTMEFVVYVLQTVFHHPPARATAIMLHVHRNGVGVAGIYPYEIAETKAAVVEAMAREREFPLRCTIEAA